MRQRKGVVLLITVGFITAIMALIAYQFSITDRGLKRTSKEKFYYQSSLILADIHEKLIPEMLKGLKSLDTNDSSNKETTAQALNSYFNVPFPIINDEKIGSAVVTISPVDTKFNINRFKTLKDEKRDFFRLFTQDLEDNMLLIDLIDLALETNQSVTSAYEYLKNDDTLALNSIFFRRGEIVDMEQFGTILDSYYAMTKDKKAYELKWDDFLDFQSYGKTPFSHISYEFCRTVFSYKNIEWIERYCSNEDAILYSQEDMPFDSDDNATFNSYNITFENYNPVIRVDIDISQNENSSHFRFFYDIEKSASSGLKIKM